MQKPESHIKKLKKLYLLEKEPPVSSQRAIPDSRGGSVNISRWENGKKDISETHDKLLRWLYLSRNPHDACNIIALLKELPSKRKKIDEPKEWLGQSEEASYPPCI